MKRTFFPSTLSLFCLAAVTNAAADPPKVTKDSKDAPAAKVETTQSAPSQKPPRISSKIDVEPVAHLSDGETREVSFATSRILKHAFQAREAIADKHQDDAARHIDQGLKLMKIIDGLLPRYKVKTQISSGEINYADEDDVTPRFVTLFEDIDRRDVISSVVKAKQEASKKSDQTDNQTEGAAKASPLPFVVSHADITYTTLKLDVDLARKMLTVARKEISQNKFELADAALHSLQAHGVLFEFEEIDLPLKQTADNLRLAEAEIKEGRLEEARAALREAIDDLKDYEENVSDQRGEEVKFLHQEIMKLTAELEGGGVSHADAQKHASTISRWRETIGKWFTRKK